jgi:hypothetical protein
MHAFQFPIPPCDQQNLLTCYQLHMVQIATMAGHCTVTNMLSDARKLPGMSAYRPLPEDRLVGEVLLHVFVACQTLSNVLTMPYDFAFRRHGQTRFADRVHRKRELSLACLRR